MVDLNADLGESFGRWTLGDDEALLGTVTSANVACGFHGGDPLVMRSTCRGAVARGVRIGAHVAYRDLAGFGRRFLDASRDEIAGDVLYQLGALAAIARAEGGEITHLKPHGALYHGASAVEAQAHGIVDAMLAFDPVLVLLGFPGSALLRIASDRGLATRTEYFVDRAYTPAGNLVDRREPGAVIHDPVEAAARAVAAARAGAADSFCVHGDTPAAVELARAVRTALEDAGIEVAAT